MTLSLISLPVTEFFFCVSVGSDWTFGSGVAGVLAEFEGEVEGEVEAGGVSVAVPILGETEGAGLVVGSVEGATEGPTDGETLALTSPGVASPLQLSQEVAAIIMIIAITNTAAAAKTR